MIELEIQFQLIIVSVISGMLVTNLYTLVDILLRNSKIIRFFVELSYFVVATIIYYFVIYKISNGVLTVYLPICLIGGCWLHMRFYDKHFSCLYKYLFSKFHSIIDSRKVKIVRLWKELIKKIIKKPKSTE